MWSDEGKVEKMNKKGKGEEEEGRERYDVAFVEGETLTLCSKLESLLERGKSEERVKEHVLHFVSKVMKVKEKATTMKSRFSKDVFVNQRLKLSELQAIGFDYDYTLSLLPSFILSSPLSTYLSYLSYLSYLFITHPLTLSFFGKGAITSQS